MKSVDFIASFINTVWQLRKPTLAALFDKEPEKIDKVLEKIRYTDSALVDSVRFRPEMASQPEKFFKLLDLIKDKYQQEIAVTNCVNELIKRGKGNLIAPLIKALESRTFKKEDLKNIAVKNAFLRGIREGVESVVRDVHEDRSITAKGYAEGLDEAWVKPNIFQFLLISC